MAFPPLVIELLMAFFVAIAGVIAAKFIGDFLLSFLKKPEIRAQLKKLGIEDSMIDFLVKIVKYGLYFFAFIIAILQFPPLRFAVPVVFLVIFFALLSVLFFSVRDFMPNLAAGFYLAKIKAFKEGESVQINGTKGTVVSFGLLSLTLKDEEGKIIIIPNSLIIKKRIIKKEV